jgi:hypothetical protein
MYEESSDWLAAHEALSRLARERASADAEEGRWLLAAFRARAHLHLGFGGFGEYVERLFGYKPRSTQEKLRVAEALEGLPALAQALEQGALHWSVVRELTRVAVAGTEHEWRDLARGKTLRQVEASVAGKRPGDAPAARSDPALLRHVLRVEMSAEALALFRDARSELRRRSGEALDDEAVLLEMARSVLQGPKDEGRANYQIALSVCPDCGRGRQAANGEWLPVGADVVELARCDGQLLGTELPPQADEPIDAGPHAAGGADPAGATPGPAASAPAGARAKQTIPPALRRAVLQRDRRRCRVPGCNNASFLDLHHVQLREDGGTNSADNLLTLCGAHHRAVHRGLLSITGRAHAASFRHADGSTYGGATDPRAVDVCAKVHSALRHLGFREAEARRALEAARSDARTQAAAQPTAEALLRAALVRLRPHSRTRA